MDEKEFDPSSSSEPSPMEDTVDKIEDAEAEKKHRASVYDGIDFPDADDPADVDDDKVIHADGNLEQEQSDIFPQNPKNAPADSGLMRSVFDLVEMFAAVTISIILCFAFIFRLNIVDGESMEDTLHTGEYLIVSDLLYTPTRGDIVVIHDMTAGSFTNPLVKRVIAVGGDVVDIDFSTWTLTVNGEVVDESDYRVLKGNAPQNYCTFPLTVEEGHVFVMGDNRNNSSDSRNAQIGQIDERCVVGKVYARVFPFNEIKFFKNPYSDQTEGQ